ncbi:hypothetical protein AB0I82_23765 [Streptomyces sp. NPDC050315]|uniref:hypothetical protein n=1 Tax=Streptomyces sp. NPDC050315 TaxID=3155039 RepID=UPI00341C4E81
MPTGSEDGDAAQSGEQDDSQPDAEETSQDREDRTNEYKRIAIEAAVNLAVTFLGGLAVEVLSKLV